MFLCHFRAPVAQHVSPVWEGIQHQVQHGASHEDSRRGEAIQVSRVREIILAEERHAVPPV